MKHIFFTAIALFLFMGAAQTQHINFGIKVGLNSYNIVADYNNENKSKLAYNLGLLGHIHLGPSYAFQPEILYSVQGTTFKSYNTNLNLNYINIPLNFQYMFDNGFRLQAGPQLGFLTSAKLVSGDSSSNVISNYKSADIGITLGVSYVKPSTGYGVDIRYNHGLTNINANKSTNSYNRGLQLTLFYLFQHRT